MKYLKKLQQDSTVKVVKILIGLYRGIFPSSNRVCRFEPTCSDYLLISVQKHGTAKGIFMTTRRLIACHPFSTRNMFDPVP